MKKKLTLSSIVFLFLSTLVGLAQVTTGKIMGNATNGKKPLEAATVSILKAKDSSLVKMVVTNKEGHFEVGNIATGRYLVMVSAISHQNAYSSMIDLQSPNLQVTLPIFTLAAIDKELKNVVVTVKKPFVEQRLDKTIVNVDAVASNSGLTVLEVLEKAPGISLDKDGAISLKGKQGVTILIDGKPTYLGGQDLVNLLKSMPSNQLEQLEIMTNPPAKYDASGNSGIINLKTKKNKARGYNGSVTVGYGQGVYAKANNSINMNYRSGKWNVFGSYGYNYNKNFQNITLLRNFRDRNSLKLLSVFEQNAYSVRNNVFQSLKVGADFYMNKKTTLGIVLTGFTNPVTENNQNNTNILNTTGELQTRNNGMNTIKRNMKNGSANINLRHEFDSTGTEISFDIDYIGYTIQNNQQFNNYFYDKNGLPKQPDELLKSGLPQQINIYSAKTDFVRPINKTTKLEAGLKSSFVNTDNDALYQNWLNNTWQMDNGRTNHFIYKENINAVYVNASKTFDTKWSAQLGLRLENTIAKGHQVTNGTTFNRNYTQLFPTAYIGFNANEKNQFGLNYGRRIERPDYEDLNPFYNFLDKYTYQVGNPYLKPQFTNSIELSHIYGGFLTTSVNYSDTKDIMTEIVAQIDSTNTTYVKPSNIASQKNIGISVNAGIPIAKWWRSNVYTNLFYNDYKGIINQEAVNVHATSFIININNQLTFKNGWGGDVSANYQSAMLRGVLSAAPMAGVNFGITKQLMKKMGTLKLGIRDPFYIQKFHGSSKYQNVDIDFRSVRDSRVINISFSYRFGKPIKNNKERKTGGAEVEQSRVKAGN